jgi:hypothetical protein
VCRNVRRLRAHLARIPCITVNKPAIANVSASHALKATAFALPVEFAFGMNSGATGLSTASTMKLIARNLLTQVLISAFALNFLDYLVLQAILIDSVFKIVLQYQSVM